jgi:hypothetical protein
MIEDAVVTSLGLGQGSGVGMHGMVNEIRCCIRGAFDQRMETRARTSFFMSLTVATISGMLESSASSSG